MASRRLEVDVVVVGGGASGVAAAVGASRTGARTLLVERNPYFGGAATHSSVLTYCGFFAQREPLEQVIGGVGDTVLQHLKRLGFYNGPYRNPTSGNVIVLLDPEATKYALDCTVRESDVMVLLHSQVIGADVMDGRIRSIECVDHAGRLTVEASSFVDASGEADLTYLAGGDVRFGDNEGHVQAGTLVMRISGVDRDVPIKRDIFYEAILAAKRDGMTSLSKEKGMVLRLPKSGHILAMFADLQVNGLDSASLTDAEMSGRDQAWHYLEVFQRYVPGFKDACLVQTGPSVGIRETRHVVGNYMLTGEDVLHGVHQPDAVARGGWPVEIHRPGAPAVYEHIRDKSFYEIPLRALGVKGLENLWCAGRIISCDPVAFASARVMGTAFGTGHAAGVAAAHQAALQQVDVQAIRAELLAQGAII